VRYRSLFLLTACLFTLGLVLNGCSLLPGRDDTPQPSDRQVDMATLQQAIEAQMQQVRANQLNMRQGDINRAQTIRQDGGYNANQTGVLTVQATNWCAPNEGGAVQINGGNPVKGFEVTLINGAQEQAAAAVHLQTNGCSLTDVKTDRSGLNWADKYDPTSLAHELGQMDDARVKVIDDFINKIGTDIPGPRQVPESDLGQAATQPLPSTSTTSLDPVTP